MERIRPLKSNKDEVDTKRTTFADEIIGWYGMAGILGAYALVSFGVVEGQSLAYQLLNLTGAFGLFWIAWKKRVYQSVVLEVVWMAVGILAVSQMFFWI